MGNLVIWHTIAAGNKGETKNKVDENHKLKIDGTLKQLIYFYLSCAFGDQAISNNAFLRSQPEILAMKLIKEAPGADTSSNEKGAAVERQNEK